MNTSPTKPAQLLVIALLIIGLGYLPKAQASYAGQIKFSHGDVQVKRHRGRTIGAFQGLALDEGDTIITGDDGQVQIVMSDEGVIAVRPNTHLRIDTYRYSNDDSDKGILGLLKGSFRAITGAIGRFNKRNYQIKTPTATIGIRGTDHEPAYIPPPEPGETAIAPPGTYDKVNAGETYIETKSGQIILAANQVGFAPADLATPPVRLPSIPAFMQATPGINRDGTPPPHGKEKPGPQGDKRNVQPHMRPPPESKSTHQPKPPFAPDGPGLPQQPPPLPPPPPGTVDPRTLPPGTTFAPPGVAVVGGDLSPNISGSGAGIVGMGGLIAVVDTENRLVQTGSPGFNYARNGAPIVDQNTVTLGGKTINWGIYSGGEIKDGMGIRQPRFFHFMIAPVATDKTTILSAVSASPMTFSTVGGYTKPITETGALGGTVNSASITLSDINGTPSVTAYTLSVTDALARNWDMKMGKLDNTANFQTVTSVGLGDFLDGTGVPLVANTCSTACTGAAIGTTHGAVIGSTPQGVISSYDLHQGNTSVTGSTLIK